MTHPMVPVIDRCAFPIPCRGLREAMLGVPPNFEGKGLSHTYGWLDGAPKEARPRLLGIVYRSKARATALLLNFCPWCGAPLRKEP